LVVGSSQAKRDLVIRNVKFGSTKMNTLDHTKIKSSIRSSNLKTRVFNKIKNPSLIITSLFSSQALRGKSFRPK